MNDEDTIEYLLDVTELAAATFDLDDKEDIKIILGLLECSESTNYFSFKRRKREWVKRWREDRVERGTFSFLINELPSDTTTFLNQLGMQPETFKYILSKIENDIKKKDTVMRKSIAPAEKLAATLLYLATGESYKSTNFQTKISDSFLCAAIPAVCGAICKYFTDEYLKFPSNKNEWETIADNFAKKWQFPHCLGALDVKHIEFQPLRKDSSLYYNYKGTNSIALLALVDADCRFTYIDVGCNGRTQDAGVLLQSDLQQTIDNADENFPADKIIGNERRLPYVIIGDSDFPLQKHIMKPYTHNTKRKERLIFNDRLERARYVVDRAFGILSSRFRIFQKRMNLPVKKIELITKTCCILHNLLSYKNENYLNDPTLHVTATTASLTIGEKYFLKSEAQSIRRGFEEYFSNEGKIHCEDKKL